MHGQSLIDMSVSSVNLIQMVSYVSVGNPQRVPNQSMEAPYSQNQMSQGGTVYTGGNFIPSIKILMEIHSTTPYHKATATPCNPCTIWGIRRWEEHRAPQVICHHHGSSQGHPTICLFWQSWIFPNYKSWQMTPSSTNYNGFRSRIKYRRTFQSLMENKGRVRAPISPPTISSVFQTLWWMIVSGYIFFQTPSLAMQRNGILDYHVHQ